MSSTRNCSGPSGQGSRLKTVIGYWRVFYRFIFHSYEYTYVEQREQGTHSLFLIIFSNSFTYRTRTDNYSNLPTIAFVNWFLRKKRNNNLYRYCRVENKKNYSVLYCIGNRIYTNEADPKFSWEVSESWSEKI
jgi:hypothetical protein